MQFYKIFVKFRENLGSRFFRDFLCFFYLKTSILPHFLQNVQILPNFANFRKFREIRENRNLGGKIEVFKQEKPYFLAKNRGGGLSGSGLADRQVEGRRDKIAENWEISIPSRGIFCTFLRPRAPSTLIWENFWKHSGKITNLHF